MSAAEAHKKHLPEHGLTDNDLESEIELVSELVVAATSSDGPMHQDEVDLLLGVSPVKAAPPAKAVSPATSAPASDSDD
jgi:hypothetical protein